MFQVLSNRFCRKADTLIIDIPPKLRGTNKENFVEKIKVLIPFIEKSSVKNVLFVSSTSVYGEENDIVTEESPLNPDTESGKQLVEAEQLLQNNTNFKTTVSAFRRINWRRPTSREIFSGSRESG